MAPVNATGRDFLESAADRWPAGTGQSGVRPTHARSIKPSMTPLEGLEHVFSIVLCDAKRQLPRNYTGSGDWNDIDQRPKSASGKWDAGKTRAKKGPFPAYSEASNNGRLAARIVPVGGDPLDGLIARGEARPARTVSDALADITRAVSPVRTQQLLDDSRGRW
ncbi:hypothetical protein [Microbacterium sp. CJ77]|uniref:hypothetical protein n=1 Tax=Microbacterium sp. CJ77 TaxID=2079201 RepID=UPI0011AF5FBD|nr:hypothetical protein [Microbacterium sp. CJ77]